MSSHLCRKRYAAGEIAYYMTLLVTDVHLQNRFLRNSQALYCSESQNKRCT